MSTLFFISKLQQQRIFLQIMTMWWTMVSKMETCTESCCAILVAQRQAALSSVSFGSLPQGQADTAADTRMGEQSKFRMTNEANATTSALLLPILLCFHLCKQY